MSIATRREFLSSAGTTALFAGVGAALAGRLGVADPLVLGRDDAGRLVFGDLEPLVTMCQETPADKLMPKLVAALQKGHDLKTLVAAGALANARAFGGTDYDGYHAMMALMPSYFISQRLPSRLAALPVLKVLHRNTARIQKTHRQHRDALAPVIGGQADIVGCTRAEDLAEAEFGVIGAAQNDPRATHALLRQVVRDDINVHRVVLAWRCLDTLSMTGDAHAGTLFRQIVRFCVDEDGRRRKNGHGEPRVREEIDRLLDENGLREKPLGTRTVPRAELERLCDVVYGAPRADAAKAVAECLADGYDPDQLGEALTLAAHRLLMNDPGRKNAQEGKPVGSVHGASVGVHALDAANAWRHLAKAGTGADRAASLMVGAYHTAGQSQHCGEAAFDSGAGFDVGKNRSADALLDLIDACVRDRDQVGAVAGARAYGEAGHDASALFDRMRRHAIAFDGALHAEKFFHTAEEEFERATPAYRWGHVEALARVTASESGFPAPGVDEARRLLGTV